MDFDILNKMKAEKLKNYLCLRQVKVTGKKAVLVARPFSDSENNVALIKTAEEVQADLKEDYNDKLEVRWKKYPRFF